MIRLTTTQSQSVLVDVVAVLESVECVEVIDKNGHAYMVEESLEQIEDMLLRDKFASDAMNGFIREDEFPLETAKYIAIYSYDMADAMLKQRRGE